MNNIRGMLEIRWCSGEESACQCRRRKRHGFYSWVRDDPPEKEMATHSSILAWEIPWTEEPGGLQSQRIRHNWPTEHARAHTHTHTVHTDYSFNTHLYWFLLSAKHCPGCQDSKWMRHRLQSVYSHLAAINGPCTSCSNPVHYRNCDQEWKVAVSEAVKEKGSSSPF